MLRTTPLSCMDELSRFGAESTNCPTGRRGKAALWGVSLHKGCSNLLKPPWPWANRRGLKPCRNNCPDVGIGKRAPRLMTVVAFPSIMLPCVLPPKLSRTNALPKPDEDADVEYATRLFGKSEKMISPIQSI